MPDYGQPIRFGANIVPLAAEVPLAFEIAARADALGYDLIGVQDHPYQWRFLDTFMLMASLLARTERVHLFPDVANLPLRGPAILAKQAMALEALSGGRFHLGLGAGGFWEAIRAMGGPDRTPGEAVQALDEAIRIIRLFWSGERTITFKGRIYSVAGVHPGAAPRHPIDIWVGGGQPRMLRLIGRLADGWIPSSSWATPERVPAMQARIDDAARAAGRELAEIRRIYNVMGQVTDGPPRGLLQGPASHWVEMLTRFAVELGFDTFIFWPAEDPVPQVERFAAEVMPAVRDAVARARGSRPAA